MVCNALELARSSFYAAKKARINNDSLDNEIWEKITRLWVDLPGIGYRKISRYLNIGGKRILRILKKYRGGKTDKPKHKSLCLFPNIIKLITKDLTKYPEKIRRGHWILRDGKNGYRKIIEPVRPYQLWATDWKEFKIRFLGITIYIFVIIDCYTRQLKGYSFSLIKDGQAALKAAQMAIDNSLKDELFKPEELIWHSDQGKAYFTNEYIAYLKHYRIKISMADRGKPTQNPYIEAFFSILVRFWINQHEFLTAIEVEESLSRFFNLYNRKWKHSGIDYQTPDERLYRYKQNLTVSLK
jgi:transposase InsO family protein